MIEGSEVISVDAEWLGALGGLELDLGCARGVFLVQMAEANPGRNFLGVERQKLRINRTQKKIRNKNLSNARVIGGEIIEVLEQVVPPESADWLHVLFPDPWPKRRHAPRRLLQPRSFSAFHRALKSGGRLRFLTDQEFYWRETLKFVGLLDGWVLTEEDPVGGWPKTEFQGRFESQGIASYGWILEKR